jgi:hypothetical protein
MITAQRTRPMCAKCGVLPSRTNGISVRGFQRWHRYCNSCSKSARAPIKKDVRCSECGFTSKYSCQLCLVDGDTICQNCNALRLMNKRNELTVDATVNLDDIRL